MDRSDTIRWLEWSEAQEQALLEAAEAILVDEGWVTASWLYGSWSRAEPARDIDVALLSEWPVSMDHVRRLPGLATRIEQEAGLPPDALDLRVLNRADPVFLGRFIADARPLYERDRATRIAFEAQALSMWLDYKPVWQRMRESALGTWADG